MDKMEIKLKERCLTCEHFYLDSGKIGLMGCGPCGPREITCLHMPVCGKYQASNDTLPDESGGGVIPSETLAGEGIHAAILLMEDGSVVACGPAKDGGGVQ